jgi:hypothetical protein
VCGVVLSFEPGVGLDVSACACKGGEAGGIAIVCSVGACTAPNVGSITRSTGSLQVYVLNTSSAGYPVKHLWVKSTCACRSQRTGCKGSVFVCPAGALLREREGTVSSPRSLYLSTDRAQGATSLQDGQLDVLLHR